MLTESHGNTNKQQLETVLGESSERSRAWGCPSACSANSTFCWNIPVPSSAACLALTLITLKCQVRNTAPVYNPPSLRTQTRLKFPHKPHDATYMSWGWAGGSCGLEHGSFPFSFCLILSLKSCGSMFPAELSKTDLLQHLERKCHQEWGWFHHPNPAALQELVCAQSFLRGVRSAPLLWGGS